MNEDKITKMALIDIELGYLMNVVSQKLFKANAVMDCISSRMDTVFGMPKASEILHPSKYFLKSMQNIGGCFGIFSPLRSSFSLHIKVR